MPMPGEPMAISATKLCLEDKPRACDPCSDALIEYNQSFVERVFYYGPFWLRWIKRVFAEDEVARAISRRPRDIFP